MSDESLTWDLKLDADTSGAKRIDDALGKISEQTHGAHDRFTKFGSEANEGFRRTGRGAEDLSHKIRYEFGTIGHSINYAKIELKDLAEAFGLYEAIEGVKRLAEGIIEVGEEILMTAAKAERFETSFKLALGAEPGGQILEYIEKIGHHTEFTQEQLKGMNLELAKSGFKGAGLARGTEAAIDLAAMSSNPQEGANSAIEALRRIRTTGRLQARALMPFGISEKQLFAELSKETGLGVETVKKRLEKGTLDIDTTLNSLYTVITHKTGRALGGAGADMEKLFSTRLKNLKEIPDLLFEKLSGTRGFAAISDFVAKLGDAFDPGGPAGQKISEGLGSIVEAIGSELKDVDLKGAAESIGSAMRAIGSYVGPAIAVFKELYHEIKSVISVAGTINNVLHDYTPLGFVEDKIVARMVKRENPVEPVDPVVADRMKGFNMEAARAELRARRLGKSTSEGFSTGAKAGGYDVTDAMRGLGDRAEGALRGRLDMHSPSRIFAELGSMVGEGFAGGIEDSAARVDAAIARMVSTPTQAARPGAGAGLIQVTIAPRVDVHAAPGMSAEEVGSIAAAKVVELTPGALQSVLEQLAMQTGAAA